MATILLIEDNDANRDILARYFRLFGHRTLLAASGIEGLALAREARPDIILLDLNLPLLNGWQTARRLKEHEDTRTIPIIAVTAHAMFDDEAKALAAGCDDYAAKPLDLQKLLHLVQRHLARSRTTVSLP